MSRPKNQGPGPLKGLLQIEPNRHADVVVLTNGA
jgi:hypothetical protein